ncbi:MAG: hypothetical protein ACPF9D_11125, partial [Owenweeksia sp.]
CINPDGSNYVYGIPVYNKEQKDVVFAVDGRQAVSGDPQKTGYNSSILSDKKGKGQDKFYSSTEIGPYAHSYLLTEVQSLDYVDLTGDGPTDDDFGGWVKFYYGVVTDYKWRTPYSEANYISGELSNDYDDKASFTYGKKDMYYLKAIETKSHIAEFELLDRVDGRGVSSEDQKTSSGKGATLKKLDQIKLYSKDDINYSSNPTPVKIVHFDYNYELCSGTENRASAGGKLTLKKVWFEFGKNKRGETSPYEFDYGTVSDLDQNPNYSNMSVDRWGNYKKIGSTYQEYVNNSKNPYVNQNEDYDGSGTVTSTDKELRDKHASAWCLKKITLPSGGEIEVDYESDDYAYVQNKEAAQMMEIVGYGSYGGTSLDDSNTKIYFKLDKQLSGTTTTQKNNEVYQYIKGMDQVFFKSYMRLKNKPGQPGDAEDYIEGYAKVKHNSGTYGFYDSNTGYFSVEPVKVHKNSWSYTHPFTKTGWQHIRMHRADLFSRPNNAFGGAMSVVLAVFDFLNSLARLITGYYNYCNINNYCERAILSSTYPGSVRLNVPDGIKYGGGHRVKKIVLNDNWSTMTSEDDFTYGQEYTYRLADGRSSGVAAYEPMVGGEENPLHQPIRYSADGGLFTNDKSLMIETPIGE